MVTLKQAKEIFTDMVSKSEEKYEIFEIWEIEFGENLYIMTVIDEKGVQHFPGDPFPSIRKTDGSLIDFRFPPPA